MKKLILLSFLIFPAIAFCQKSGTTVMDTVKQIYEAADVMPEFPGGYDSLARYISRNVTYPANAMENNIQGRVNVEFIIENDGTVSNIKVVSTPFGFGLEEEAMRVVKAMPRWTPGSYRSTPVRVRYTLPISFKLR